MPRAQDRSWGRASELADIDGQVAITGVGEADASKASGRSSDEIALQAIERAIADAGLRPDEVDGLMTSGLMGDQLGVAAFHQHFGTNHEIWTSNHGGGMSYAATATHHAARALASGRARHIVNVFAVSWASEKAASDGGRGAGPGKYHEAEQLKANLEVPFGWFPQPVYFATIARRHMHEYGTTEEQLGAIAVACRRHANHTPGAVMHDKPLSLEEHLAQPYLVAPLRLTDCCLVSDGGGAFVMTTPERARDRPKRPVRVRGVGEGRSNAELYWSQQGDFTATPQVFSAAQAFEMAGIVPADVDLLTLYDPFTIVALMQIEDMGFCEKGEGGAFVASGALDFDGGVLPYNTHGGLLSHAYVLGIAHVVEVVRQLRGEAAAQVPDAAIGVYGGYTGQLASTLVLSRD